MRKALIFLVTFFVTLSAFSAFITEDDTIATRIQDGKWVSDLDADGEDSSVAASDVHLAFSDLISGPDTGLGDGNGSGVIVTVWGYGLGSSQGGSTIEYCDSTSTCRAGYVYYWKDADGTLPSGPANLYESHGMQEIAFSIPDSAQGAGTIRVTVGGLTSTLPFTVRAGNIYHVTSTGNDTTGDGSWANPWRTVGKADSTVDAGSTIYIGSLIEGSESTDKAIYNNRGSAMSTLEAQYMYVAYPNSRVDVIGHRGVTGYNSDNAVTGIGFAKLSIFAAEADVGANDQPINARANVSTGTDGFKDGRVVGNYFTDEHPSDANGACPDATGGAIQGGYLNGNKVENLKVLGNMIHEYGCAGTSKLHHTTYFTMRSQGQDVSVPAPEIAYNYLKDNHTKSGIHYYDEYQSGDICGDFSTTFKIHNNVVVNQAGPGINFGATCIVDTPFEIYNNVVVNAGLKADWDGIDGPSNGSVPNSIAIRGSGTIATSVLDIYNNTFIDWNTDGETTVTDACIGLYGSGTGLTINFNDNICAQSIDRPYIQENYQNPEYTLQGGDNVWYTSAGTQANAVSPSWDTTKITTDPLLTVTGSKVSVDSGSPLIGQSSTTLPRDIYGNTRGATSNVGAVQTGNQSIAGIIFETNFANDAGYSMTGEGYFDFVDVPEGWDGVRTNNGTIEGVAGAGVAGGVAMKFTWPQGNGQILANSLFKHLTDDENTGYEELYVRYKVKLPNNFKAGEGGEALPFWKWGRLWQNTGLAGSGWTEQRPDSYYIVWNWSNGLPIWGIRNNLTFGENLNTDSLGSAGGPRAGTDWYGNGAGVGSDDIDAHIGVAGNWDNVGGGAWRFDHSTRFLADNSNQDWHTLEWRFKLSSTATANDGEFQVWFDGVEQVHPNVIDGIDQTIDQPSTTNSLVTAALPGFNFFTLFDNMAEWSSDQPTEIFINDVVISTERIGHDYVAGSVQ